MTEGRLAESDESLCKPHSSGKGRSPNANYLLCVFKIQICTFVQETQWSVLVDQGTLVEES